MTFLHYKYLWGAILFAISFSVLFFVYDKRYFNWVKKYWFYNRSITSRLSSLLFILGCIVLSISLLDPRGESENVNTQIPSQKTIIMIDNSASMLAEDVRPNRLGRAILMAKHFVQNAANHEISILLFSDFSKQVVPFTDDVDLLESILSGLESINLNKGGSNISRSINEAISYLGVGENISGNLLIFTDAEENGDAFEINVPPRVNVALVGVGTVNGSNIPYRDRNGRFQRYLKYNNEEVITKLDENFLNKISNSITRSKTWIALSYNLPTEEILDFFRKNFSEDLTSGNVVVKPVLAHIFYIPGIIILIFSLVLKLFSPYKIPISILLILFSLNLFAQQQIENPKDQSDLITKYKAGKLDNEQKLKLAEEFLKQNKIEDSLKIYKENSSNSNDPKVFFNYATGLLKKGEISEALSVVNSIKDRFPLTDENKSLIDKMRSNVLLALQEQKQKKDNKEDKNNKDSKENNNSDQNNKQDNKNDKQDKENKEKSDNDKDNKSNNDENKDKQENKSDPNKNNENSSKSNDSDSKQNDSKNKNDDHKDQSGNNDKQNSVEKSQDNLKNLEKDSKNDKDKDNDENENESDKQDDSKSQGQSLEDKEQEIAQKRKLLKVPAMLRQLLDDDRELQEKFLDNVTSEKSNIQKKEW